MAATSVVAALVGGAAWAAVVLEDGRGPEVDCSVTEAQTFGEAQLVAERCGHDVAVIDTYDPWSRQMAGPDGTAVVEYSSGAVRTDIHGDWQGVDPTVVVDEATGELKVAAPVFDITLDPADKEGFLRIAQEGVQVSMGVPVDLGEPVVEGASVTWPLLGASGDVIAGAVLRAVVHDDASGVTPVIEVRDPESYALLDAAAGGEGIAFIVSTEGDSSIDATGEAGGFSVVDEATGDAVFSGGRATQWDSSGTDGQPGVESPTDGDDDADPGSPAATTDPGQPVEDVPLPEPGAVVSDLDVSVLDESTIAISADESMVTDPETVWPISIDPTIEGTTLHEWVMVRTHWDDRYKTSTDEGVGMCDASEDSTCGKDYVARLFWQFTGMSKVAALEAADIKEAYFSVRGTHSYDCSGYSLQVHSMDKGISEKTTWANQPSTGEYMSSRYPNHRSQCGGPSTVEWNVLDGIRSAAKDDKTSVTFRVKAATETSMKSWRRYKMDDAKLIYRYDRRPTITAAATRVGQSSYACPSGVDRPIIATGTPTLKVVTNDEDENKVRAEFELYAGSTLLWSSETEYETGKYTQTVQVPKSEGLKDGTTYRWRARAVERERKLDGTDASLTSEEWAGWCEFTVDISKPVPPIITPVVPTSGLDLGIQAVYQTGVERGGLGQKGCFKISRGASGDVTRIVHNLTASGANESEKVGDDGSVTVCHPSSFPKTTGAHSLTAHSYDVAGNPSDPATYTYRVATAREDGVWSFDRRANPVVDESTHMNQPTSAGSLTVSGATWEPGPHTLFGSRTGDWALRFNGANRAQAVSAAPVIDTSQSFVVSAHVMIDALAGTQTVLSQDGTRGSAFSLRFEKNGCLPQTQPDGCWVFSMHNRNGDIANIVKSTVRPMAGRWTHLTAEYNAGTPHLKLWACDIGTPDAPGPGVPAEVVGGGPSAMWDSSGVFAVGRGFYNGVPTHYWSGLIDNVRIFRGKVVADAKVRRVCQGAEAWDFTNGISGIDPTLGGK